MLGVRQVVTGTWDRSVGWHFKPRPTAGRLYLLAEDAGRQKLFTVSVNGGSVREVGA